MVFYQKYPYRPAPERKEVKERRPVVRGRGTRPAAARRRGAPAAALKLLQLSKLLGLLLVLALDLALLSLKKNCYVFLCRFLLPVTGAIILLPLLQSEAEIIPAISQRKDASLFRQHILLGKVYNVRPLTFK